MDADSGSMVVPKPIAAGVDSSLDIRQEAAADAGVTIDSGWREVAETGLAFVRRFA
ncbi:hypothetical protein [Nocardia sp. CA-290969]|uniref:hypothetical protein n=1 Tax=Nocardia sp. CA-290969 TaxID=3239986 RepID=UPI003D8FC377